MRAIKVGLVIVGLFTILFLEAEYMPTIPNTWWDLGEHIRLLKLNCKSHYPICSMSIHLKSQNLIVIWKGQRWAGDEQGYIGFRYE